MVLQLFVQAAFEFADLAAAQAGNVDVVPRPMRLVIVAVAAQMKQIQLIDEALFFQQVNRAVNRNEVYSRVHLLRPLENLIHVQMLLGVVHHLQNHSPLARHSNPARSHRLL